MDRLQFIAIVIIGTLLLCQQHVSSFSIKSIHLSNKNVFSGRNLLRMYSSSQSPDIDDIDSSELNFGSSTDYKITQQKEMLKEEEIQSNMIKSLLQLAQKKADEIGSSSTAATTSTSATADFAANSKDLPPQKPAAVFVPKAVVAEVVNKVNDSSKPLLPTTLSTAGSGFDIGLLIAFPVMIATLGFFFLFPLFHDTLGNSLPPPMSY